MSRHQVIKKTDSINKLHVTRMCAMLLCVILFLSIGLTEQNLTAFAGQELTLTFSLTQQEEAICYHYKDQKLTLAVSGQNDYFESQENGLTGGVVPILQFFEEELGITVEVISSAAEADLNYVKYSDQISQENTGAFVVFRSGKNSESVLYSISPKLSGLLEIFDRYANMTQEGEVLASHILAQEEQCEVIRFAEENADILARVKQNYDTICWSAVSEYDAPLYYRYQGDTKGLILPVLDYITRITGIMCIDMTDEVQSDPVTALEENKIQLITGIAKTKDNANLDFLTALYENELVFIVPEDSELSSFENAKYLYWGIENTVVPLVTNADLKDRMINFNGLTEALQALDREEIGGLLIQKGQAELWNLSEEKYRIFEDNAITVTEYAAGNEKNEALNQLIERLIINYKTENADAFAETGLPVKLSQSFLQQCYGKLLLLPEWGIIASCTFLCVLLILLRFYGSRNRKNSRSSRSHNEK